MWGIGLGNVQQKVSKYGNYPNYLVIWYVVLVMQVWETKQTNELMKERAMNKYKMKRGG